MIDPTLTVSLFKTRQTRGIVKMNHTAPVYAEPGNISMEATLRAILANMRDVPLARHYITFTRYRRNHKKEDILECTAVMLEYPYKELSELKKRLASLGHAHYLIDTQKDFTVVAEARVLVVFPVLEPITTPSRYTRAASLLYDEIGIHAKTNGADRSTFAFAPYTVNPGVTFVDGTILDASAYIEAHRGHWVEVLKPGPLVDEGFVNDDTDMFYFPPGTP